ncbi:MAG: triosephosphate isomerase [Bacteriovoracaceae bacterium]|jgi:triosephosphate isomerase
MTHKYYIVGNWKMNQTRSEIKSFFKDLGTLPDNKKYEAWIAPQAIHLNIVLENGIKAGAQNVSDNDSGAHTGETSPSALVDLGAEFTLVGHSERRAIYKEDNDFINRKLRLSLEKGLKVILCCGESLEERENGMTESVVNRQIEKGLQDVHEAQRQNIIIAYEPVWAIGTGKTASPEQADSVHESIRAKLVELWDEEAAKTASILYGGSVKPANVAGLLAQTNIDGALVGGASLKGADFRALCDAAEARPE